MLATLSLRTWSAAALCALAAVGCAGADGDASNADTEEVTADEALRAGIDPGTFKLYDAPNHQPTGCDVYTALALKRSSATLEERVGGLCKLAVAPNARTYRLKSTTGTCGIKTYTGAKTIAGVHHSIEISDYRTMTCALATPYFGEIVVRETVGTSAPHTMYSTP